MIEDSEVASSEEQGPWCPPNTELVLFRLGKDFEALSFPVKSLDQ
jgi:hypothetical protein